MIKLHHAFYNQPPPYICLQMLKPFYNLSCNICNWSIFHWFKVVLYKIQCLVEIGININTWNWLDIKQNLLSSIWLSLSQTLLLCFDNRAYAWNKKTVRYIFPEQEYLQILSMPQSRYRIPDHYVALKLLNLGTFYIWIWSQKKRENWDFVTRIQEHASYLEMAFSTGSLIFYIENWIRNFLLVSKQLGRMHLLPVSLSDILLTWSTPSSILLNMILIYA